MNHVVLKCFNLLSPRWVLPALVQTKYHSKFALAKYDNARFLITATAPTKCQT
jgi:hypothetical protein